MSPLRHFGAATAELQLADFIIILGAVTTSAMTRHPETATIAVRRTADHSTEEIAAAVTAAIKQRTDARVPRYLARRRRRRASPGRRPGAN